MSNSPSPSLSKPECIVGEEPSLVTRRPSWTPSLPEGSILELYDKRLRRRRSKHVDDHNLLSVEHNAGPQKSRKPSIPSIVTDTYHRSPRRPRMELEESPDVGKALPGGNFSSLPDSPEDLRRSWEINVKDLVGDAVGNMSISPASRDIVLATRKGLFIIDLKAAFDVPRFLPQGGTWDVADVQWNPHPSHAQYIVSTSSEKLLIWNLRLGGKSSIEHILRSHYRAITDINWHTTECDIVCSTGIDSWVWAWDLRQPQKPIFGLSPFKAGGTQVKWNYQDSNILASSHSNEVLIWDRRKGSLPITQIRAHSSKIYGIDWCRSHRNEIVTCSLDKSIKTWDINEANPQGICEPKSCIHTAYPVWRARNIPFGKGILSLPQRGETTLELYAKGMPQQPVETFEGHSDVVKEFVWRKGIQDDFQLITWSKDRTLKFWPLDPEVIQKVGHVPEVVRGRSKLTRNEMDTFRNPPEVEEKKHFPALSAPVGNRGILAEVRAAYPIFPILGLPVLDPPPTMDGDQALTPIVLNDKVVPSLSVVGRPVGGTMSKGGMNSAQMDQLQWLASVKVTAKRESSSGGRSHGDSGPSRLGSGSRAPSGPDRGVNEGESRQRSGSQSHHTDERKENEGNQSLQDEITTVLTKLSSSGIKIKLEKHDLQKKRTCTIGLQGPWGETSSVFMRVNFTFPRDYPQATYPYGTPMIEVERNPLISMSDRAFILKRLRGIRERKRPCLEASLRFLLFADERKNDKDMMGSDSSSDEDPSADKESDVIRNIKNLGETRTSQGSFGPNGQFICFFRNPPKLPRIKIRDFRISPITPSKFETPEITPIIGQEAVQVTGLPQPQPDQQLLSQSQTQPPRQKTSYLQSPALLSDAVRRLGLAAMDRTVQPIDPRNPQAGSSILRAMTNLLTVPQQVNTRRDTKSESGAVNVMRPSKRSTVLFLSNANLIAGPDPTVVLDYIFSANSLVEVCEKNAVAARRHRRYDHERVFKTMRTLFTAEGHRHNPGRESTFASDSLAAKVITNLYDEIAKEKDVQMLAMVAMLVLQTEHGVIAPPNLNKKESNTIPHLSRRTGSGDYFSISKSLHTNIPMPHVWPSSVAPSLSPPLSSSNSSRGSWSSLFNTGNMRQFMHGVQDTLKDGLTTPQDIFTPLEIHPLISRSAEKRNQDLLGPAARRQKLKKESSLYSSMDSKSWNEGSQTHPSKALTASFYSAGNKRPSSRLTDPSAHFNEKRTVFFEPPPEEISPSLFDPTLLEQFKLNVYVYTEILFGWQMFHKRLELLKAVSQQEVIHPVKSDQHLISLHRLCARPDCNMSIPDKSSSCKYCNTPCNMPSCAVCRLPVKGVSRTCALCSHVTHISCWNSLELPVPICPTGCGCFCSGSGGTFTRPSTRLGFTPQLSTLLLT